MSEMESPRLGTWLKTPLECPENCRGGVEEGSGGEVRYNYLNMQHRLWNVKLSQHHFGIHPDSKHEQ